MRFSPSTIAIILAGITIFSLLTGIFVSSRQHFKPLPRQNREYELRTLPPEIEIMLKNITPATSIRVPILMYHYVEHVTDTRDTIRQSLNTPPAIFEAQISTLKHAGYTFLTARELGYVLDGERSLPYKPVIITIDDGHWDVYTDILPILKKYKVKATLYHVAGFTGGSDFLSEEQLKSVVKSGLVELGSHTVHHVNLQGRGREEVLMEITLSKHMLELTFGTKIDSFAYPNGGFDLQAVELAKEAGYKTAVSTVPGIESSQQNRFFLPRLRPGNRTGETLLHWLEKDTFTPYE